MSPGADRHLRVAALVALAVLLVDQATKAVVEHTMVLHQTIPLTPFFALTYVRNTGAAFGLLADAPAALRLPLFVVVTVVALLALGAYLRSMPPQRPWLAASVGGILGGALGNLVCRLRYGEVIDFLHLHWGSLSWPMFNVADSAITVGVVIVLFESFRAPGARADSADSSPAGE